MMNTKSMIGWHRTPAVFLIAVVLVLLVPVAAANDFIIQDDTESPILAANGTTGNVGIGLLEPSTALEITGTTTLGGNLDMSSNNITGVNEIQGFFETSLGGAGQCESNQFVQYIYANGTYKCESAGTAEANTYVNVSGDTMTGQLNMSNNSINNVSYLNEYGGTLRIGSLLSMQNNDISDVDALSATTLTVSTPLTDGNISHNLTVSAAGTVDPGAFNRTVANDEVDEDLTISSSGNINPAALNRLLREGEIRNDTSTNASGFVNSSAVETRIAGNQLDMTDGVLDVQEGPRSGLDADTVYGFNLSEVNWTQVAMDQSHVQPEDVSLESLSPGDGLSGSAYDGTSSETWSVAWSDAMDLNESGAINDNVVGDSRLDNDASFTMSGLQVTGSGFATQFDNDVQILGDLDVRGNVTNTNVEHLNVNGSLLPPEAQNDTFDVGNNQRWWRNAYFGGDIAVSGQVDGVDIGSPEAGIRIDGTSNGYTLNTDDSTVTVDSSLKVVDGGIGDTQLAGDELLNVFALDIEQGLTAGNISLGAGLASGTDDAVAANVDDSTIEVDGSLQIVDRGVDSLQIAYDAVNTSHIGAAAVTNAEIANDAINYTQLDGGNCGNDELLVSNGDDWNCVKNASIGDGDPDQTLSAVLDEGNQTGGTDIDMQGGSVRSTSGEVCIGDQCT